MNQLQASRMLTWAATLRNVPKSKFDLSCWNEVADEQLVDNIENGFGKSGKLVKNTSNVLRSILEDYSCNTNACAAGWLPTTFPRHWEFGHGDVNGPPHLKDPLEFDAGIASEASHFFGVPIHVFDTLFYVSRIAEYCNHNERLELFTDDIGNVVSVRLNKGMFKDPNKFADVLERIVAAYGYEAA